MLTAIAGMVIAEPAMDDDDDDDVAGGVLLLLLLLVLVGAKDVVAGG